MAPLLFNSLGFLFVFAPLTYGIYWWVESDDARKRVSLVASYVFYGVWSVKFAGLMLATTGVDYFTAKIIEDAADPKRKRAWLAGSLTVNLGVLGTFKYFDFFASSLNGLMPRPVLPLLHVALPIGISFYTFESMSYVIDVYRGKAPAARRFLDYGHFVTMFPRLVAGPIVRYSDLLTQLRSLPRALTSDVVLEALLFFTVGFAKKVLLADFLATKLVDACFGQARVIGAVPAWAAAFGYSAQLYMDFSGYSDMAVGLGLLLGLRLPRNFNLPYQARNIGEFWRRWHMTWSSWLRDYLYIPLGGNRSHHLRNLFLTMLVGGLWHGANWTFVLWGAYHGVALVFYRVIGHRASLPRILSIALTFLTVVIGRVLFRAPTIGEALDLYRGMVGLHGLDLPWLAPHLAPLAVLAVTLALSFSVDTYDLRAPRRLVTSLALGVVLFLCCLRLSAPSPFLYFQFLERGSLNLMVQRKTL